MSTNRNKQSAMRPNQSNQLVLKMVAQQIKKKKETLSESSQGPSSARLEGISVLPTGKNSTLPPIVGLNSETHVVSTDQPISGVSRA